ncbi:uncharacterized protein MELLADRAFT_67740 [Melampsora larici-populina 98AG31]|uniref:Uncharacterized protein n=1 Tax=Melampsora larici-populina (strain 98AG31 / pathotype 3-4-7) TaxID=747676 RepID=F4S442_MELLP|nr:uncharacterized protein MELLADRAFT_67740 [Melampsora larici-populina 98AG31]EGG00520.1 hypothetical protein MELLADRAFT_67740 [Melampsora larici-populina 98AG31]
MKESLKTYLEKPPKERKELYPFFEMSQPQSHRTYTKLINQMLQSEREAWAEKIQDLLKLESANEKISLWNFLLELINHMPTQAVQVTLMAALKEQEKFFMREGSVNEDMEKLLDEVKLKCVHEIKYHATSLKDQPKLMSWDHDTTRSKSDRFQNIFTKQKQEKLGKYKMKLEQEWLPSQANNLFEYWATPHIDYFWISEDMDVYLKVKASFKANIENQVVLINLIQARQNNFEKIKLVPEFEQWIASQIEKLTHELIDFINTLNDECKQELTILFQNGFVISREIIKFESLQLQLSDGFAIIGSWTPGQKKKLLTFWSKNIPFYLEIKDTEAKETWLPNLEELILQDTDHMESVIQDFLKIPIPSNSEESTLERFLKFHVEETRAQSVKKMSERGLQYGTTA